jgi:hypothetical protein
MRSLIVVTILCLTSTPAFACSFDTDCKGRRNVLTTLSAVCLCLLGRGKMVTWYARSLLAVAGALLLAPVPTSALQYGQVSLAPPYVGITATGPIVPGDFDRLGEGTLR